ncbi:MAG: DUF192 domain-containing protein [Verrucomicrobiota bacterium]|nr:DUF192 domain-containing protein [Verrucomicrobiota bacterium]
MDTPLIATASVADYLSLQIDSTTVKAQIAVLASERQQGLMYRESLPEDSGMLFVFDKAQPLSFYMRNTRIPLDIGYFTADGVLREVYQMYPGDENSVKSRNTAIQFALEMNQGWFARKGLRPGAKLDMAVLAGLLRKRGIKPEAFRIPTN